MQWKLLLKRLRRKILSRQKLYTAFENFKQYRKGLIDAVMVGERARTVLDDQSFKIAVETYQANLLNEIIECKLSDVERISELKLRYQTVDDVLYELGNLITEMEIQKKERDQADERKKPSRRDDTRYN